MKKKISISLGVIVLMSFVSACSPSQPSSTPTPTEEPAATFPMTPEPTQTEIPTPTVTFTPEPFSVSSIGFPLYVEDVICLHTNYGDPTSYGDYTHDGVDIVVDKSSEVSVLAVADGVITQSSFVNDTVGYEIYIFHGLNEIGEKVFSNYVHLDFASPINTQVKKGDEIGSITNPHGGHDDYILYFGIRVGDQPRYESPSDGAIGNEGDVTDYLLNFIDYSLICN